MACLYTAHFGKSPCGGALFRIGRDSGVLPVSFSERQSLPSSLLFQSPLLPLLSLSTLLTLSLTLLSLCIAGQLPFLSPAMSQNTTQKPLPFGYQFAAGAVAGVSEVCLYSKPPFSIQGSKTSC